MRWRGTVGENGPVSRVLSLVLPALAAVALLALVVYDVPFAELAQQTPGLGTVICNERFAVSLQNGAGEAALSRPDSVLWVFTNVSGVPREAHVTLYVREPGGEWRYEWELDTRDGQVPFYLGSVSPGMQAYAKATAASGGTCVGESKPIAAPAS